MKNIIKAGLALGSLFISFNASALTSTEIEDILFLKQEEKLARDVYTALAETSDLRIFSNIARSEQRHMDALDYLIDVNGLVDACPVDAGVFTYPELTALYEELVVSGSASTMDALEVGKLIEEVDIEDLEVFLSYTTDEETLRVYNNLLNGSEKHLSAFTRMIALANGEEIDRVGNMGGQGRNAGRGSRNLQGQGSRGNAGACQQSGNGTGECIYQ